jgi:hypothetical protein
MRGLLMPRSPHQSWYEPPYRLPLKKAKEAERELAGAPAFDWQRLVDIDIAVFDAIGAELAAPGANSLWETLSSLSVGRQSWCRTVMAEARVCNAGFVSFLRDALTDGQLEDVVHGYQLFEEHDLAGRLTRGQTLLSTTPFGVSPPEVVARQLREIRGANEFASGTLGRLRYALKNQTDFFLPE